MEINFEELLQQIESTYLVETEGGNNKDAVNMLTEMVKKGLQSSDENIRTIFSNTTGIKEKFEGFNIWIGDSFKTGYLLKFGVINVQSKDINDYVTLLHEYGHAVFDIVLQGEYPEDFENIVNQAVNNAYSFKNQKIELGDLKLEDGKFLNVLEYMCDEKNKESTIGMGPLSDIMSAMWQVNAFSKPNGEQLVLPYSHSREAYLKEDGGIDYKRVYDEQFANFFSLKANNCTEELNLLRNMFGEEWYNSMNEKILEATQVLDQDNYSM